jgi:hypothetical protein
MLRVDGGMREITSRLWKYREKTLNLIPVVASAVVVSDCLCVFVGFS